MLNFINAFDVFKDSDTYVDVTENQLNKINSFIQNFNIQTISDESGETGEYIPEQEFKIKLISEEDFDAAAYIKYGLTQSFGYYENGTSRLGIPMSTYNDITSQSAIMFDNFYWKNNYTENKVTKNGIECVAYEQWTTRGIGFNNLIIDSTVPVFFGMHVWGNGYWENTIVYVNDELVESYVTLFGGDSPKAVRPLSKYNINNASTANWWLTY